MSGGSPLLPQLTSLEQHSGLIFGRGSHRFEFVETDLHPRAALEAAILDVLGAGDCVVQFSGGRDSSLVLAIAVHVARREGLALPVALCVRYPEVAETNESSWQQAVADHLDVPLEVVTRTAGQDDVTAPLAVSWLAEVGPHCPVPAAITTGRIAPAVAGRSVLTGEGGDEVLGPSRITNAVAYWRRRRRPGPRVALAIAEELLPPRWRIAARRDRSPFDLAPWLTPHHREQVTTQFMHEALSGPLDWREERRDFASTRLMEVALSTLDAAAAWAGFSLHHPLMDRTFISALSRFGGPRGLTSRTEAMRVLAGDLLPESVIRRGDKAWFNGVYAGGRVGEFARSWDGTGVDPEFVDVDRLRQAWTAEQIPASSLAPLQLALVAALEQGWNPEGRV